MNERERELHEYRVSRYSMKRANYRLTDEITKRCNVCVSGQIVLATAIRICKIHQSFVTCGATCDLHELDQKYNSLRGGLEERCPDITEDYEEAEE